MEKISPEDIAGDAQSGEKPAPKTAREHVMEFIKVPDNSLYEFQIDTIIHEPEKFIHNMRVVLSKLRNLVRKRNRPVKPFKMMFVSFEKIDERFVKVVLRKEMDSFVEEMNDTLDALTMGKQNDGKEIATGTSSGSNEQTSGSS